MREHKFEAWHETAKEMLKETNAGDVFRWKAEGQPIKIREWTGLKDKNGKEIYEGDIIKYKEIIPSENKIQKIIQGADFVYLEFVGQVVWDGEGASFDVDGGDRGYRGFGARGSTEYEVIGNIYESPTEATP